MHAGFGNIRDFDVRVFSSLPLSNLHPEMVQKRLGRGYRRKIVPVMFIPAGQKAVVAAGALIQIDE
jgi:hypothetical protein